MAVEDKDEDSAYDTVSTTSDHGNPEDFWGARPLHEVLLREALGFDIIGFPLTGRAAWSPMGALVRAELNAASLNEFCKIDIGIQQPPIHEGRLPRHQIRQLSVADLLAETRVEQSKDNGPSIPWWQMLVDHEEEHMATRYRKNMIIDMARSILTPEESRANFLATMEDTKTTRKKKKNKKKRKGKRATNALQTVEGQSNAQEQIEEELNRTVVDQMESPNAGEQTFGILRTSRAEALNPTIHPSLSNDGDAKAEPQQVISSTWDFSKNKRAKSAAAARKTRIDSTNKNGDIKSCEAKKNLDDENIMSMRSDVWSSLDVLSAGHSDNGNIDVQTAPDDSRTFILSEDTSEKNINVTLPLYEKTSNSKTPPLLPRKDNFSKSLDVEPTNYIIPARNSNNGEEITKLGGVPKELRAIHRPRRDTLPYLIPNEPRARRFRAETLPAYELGGEPQTVIHHTQAQFVKHNRRDPGKDITSLLFRCASPTCGRRLLHRDSLICHLCGPCSKTRYCTNEHRLGDAERHYFHCGTQAIVEPTYDYSPPIDFHIKFPPVRSSVGFANAKRTRQLTYAMHNPRGQYSLFLDPQCTARYGLSSPLTLGWPLLPTDVRLPPVAAVQGLLAICFENHTLDCVVRLAYVFVRANMEHVFNPVAEEMIAQLDAQFALEFAYNVPHGWPWDLRTALWVGWRAVLDLCRPQLLALPEPYALRLSNMEMKWLNL